MQYKEAGEVRYEIRRIIGKGNFGTVYEVWDNVLKVKRAMKVMDNESAEETKVLKNLQIDGIPRVMDAFSSGEKCCYVMEFMEGENLKEWVIKNPYRTEAEISDIAEQICRLITMLHQQIPPIIYGDLKPENVLVQKNRRISLVDFGSCRVEGEPIGRISGTYGYAPKEQILGICLNTGCDVYAIGKILCYLQNRENTVLPVSAKQNQMNRKWKRFLNKCMEENQKLRYKSAIEAYDDIVCCRKKSNFGLSFISDLVRVGRYFLKLLLFLLSVALLTIGMEQYFISEGFNGRWYILAGFFSLLLYSRMESPKESRPEELLKERKVSIVLCDINMDAENGK